MHACAMIQKGSKEKKAPEKEKRVLIDVELEEKDGRKKLKGEKGAEKERRG